MSKVVAPRRSKAVIAVALPLLVGWLLLGVLVSDPASASYTRSCDGASSEPGAFPDAGLAADCLKLYGVSLGKADGTFGEHDPLRRSQISSFLVRFINLAGVPLPQHATFPDVNESTVPNAQVRDEIERLAGAGVIKGFPDGTFRPNDNLSVAQAATLMVRALAFIHAHDVSAPEFVDQGDTLANYHYAISKGILDTGAPGPARQDGQPRTQAVDVNGQPYPDGPSDTTLRGLMADMLAQGIDQLVGANVINNRSTTTTTSTSTTSGGGGGGALPPTAHDDAATTLEDGGALTVAAPGVLANDISNSGGLLTAHLDNNVAHGTLNLNPNGSFTYTPNANFFGPDTFTYHANDGLSSSTPATVTITVTGVNDPPSFTKGPNQSVNEDAGPITVSSWATSISSGPGESDTLNFVVNNDNNALFATQPAVSPSGALSFQSALNASGSANVTVTLHDNGGTANGGSDSSAPQTFTITVSSVNDAPVVTTSAGSAAYTEGGAATTVDNALTVTDVDDANLESGQVRISSSFQAGDVLSFVNQNGITGSYNAGTGVLTLTGTSSVANYQTALRSITYSNSTDNPSTSKTIEFTVNDGDTNSAAATKTIVVTPVNDAPVVTTSGGQASYTEAGPPVAVDPGLTATDPDSTNLSGATVSITTNFTSADGDTLNFTNQNGISGSYNASTGILTLSGAATVGNYQSALRSVTFSLTSGNPSTATRTVSFQVTDDAAAASNTATRNVTVTAVNTAPLVIASVGNTAYTEGDPATTIDAAITVVDPDSANLQSGQVRISAGFESGDSLVFVNQNGITGSYNAGTGVLTLTGSSSVANYQTALRSIKYSTPSDNPATSKTVEFKVNDGSADSNLATKGIAVTRVNDAPVVTTSGGSTSFLSGGGAVVIDSGITVSDVDSANLVGATVSITANFQSTEDVLAFVNTANITGSYNAGTGVLTLTGSDTVANYQAALRTVTYNDTAGSPNTATRTVSFQVDDGAAANNLSNVATKNVAFNQPPVVTTSVGNTAYTENGAPLAIDAALTVTDPDSANLASGQVRISAGFDSGDTLAFTNQNGISGSYNSGTGVLTLTGSSSVANYQTALRSVQFSSTNDNPATSKTVEFKVNDGLVDSNLATKGIAVTRVNDAPTVTTSGGSASFTEDGGAVAIDNGVTVTDPDSTNGQSATVSITANFQSGADVLAFTNTATITGSYNAGTGVLTLSGVDTLANYQAALRTITFNNTSQNPSTSTRTIGFQVTDDGAAASSTANRTVTITAVNDAPVLTQPDAAALSYTENAAATVITPNMTVSDADSANLAGATAQITGSYANGQDVLSLGSNPQNGITASFNAATGTLTLTGSASVANYQTALRDIRYANSSNDPSTSTRTVTFQANDGAVSNNLSNTVTRDISITAVNDAPTAAAQSFNAQANMKISIPAPGLLTGATDAEAGTTLTVGTVGPTTTPTGGVISNVNTSTGAFDFDPPPGATSATFSYTVCDNGNPGPGLCSAPATVTFTLAGPVIWFVNPSTGSDLNTGTLASPFATLGKAGTVDATNHAVFLFSGGTSATGIALETNETLLGQAANTGGTFDQYFSITPPSGTIARPSLNTGTATSGGTVTLNTNSKVQGLTISSGTSAAMNDVAGAITGVNVSQVALSTTNGAALDLDQTAGTLQFNAVSKSGTGVGVELTNNTGGTFSFTGGITISSGASAAFTATGGGTVTATQNNTSIVNTLATTTGTGLNVANTTIGASGLTFRSISSNGAVNGIILNTTGALGGLTVSGDTGSSNNSSGGTIQNATVGISLASTRDVSLDQVNIQTTSDSGINGTGVTNFTLTNSTIANAGNATSESSVAFNGTNTLIGNNIAGTLTITGNTLSNGFYSGVDVQADDGTVTSAVISNNTITPNTGSGISFAGTGNASTAFNLSDATIDHNTITNAGQDGIQVSVSNSSAGGPGASAGIPNDASHLIDVTNNTITLKSTAAQAIALVSTGGNSGSRTQMNFNVSCNGRTTGGCTATAPLGSSEGTVILVGNNGFSTMTGVIDNNAITATQTPGLAGANGIGGGNGVAGAGNTWTPNLTLTVTNNSISGTDGNGILLVGRGATGTANMKIANNTVGAPVNAGGSARQGIRVDAGNAASADDAVCLNISGNTSAGSNGASGIGIRKNGTVATTNDFGLQGSPALSPSPASAATADTYVTTNNPSGGGTDVISGDNFVACNTAPP